MVKQRHLTILAWLSRVSRIVLTSRSLIFPLHSAHRNVVYCSVLQQYFNLSKCILEMFFGLTHTPRQSLLERYLSGLLEVSNLFQTTFFQWCVHSMVYRKLVFTGSELITSITLLEWELFLQFVMLVSYSLLNLVSISRKRPSVQSKPLALPVIKQTIYWMLVTNHF